MKQRAISSVVFTIAMLGGVFGGAETFFTLFLIITAGCLWELMGMLFREENYVIWRKVIGTALGVLPFMLAGFSTLGCCKTTFNEGLRSILFTPAIGEHAGAILLSLGLLVFLIFLLLLAELFLQSGKPFSAVANYLLGVVYAGAPFTFLIFIAFWHDGYAPLRVLGLLLLNWTNDTMAYLVGSRIGRSPFFSRISPKKTWEGTLGGIGFTFLVAFGLSHWIKDFTMAEWLLLAGSVGIFGTLGDLVESMLKRSVQLKDSGSILPGHGGFLDRFDSFLFVLPFAWLVLTIFRG